MDNGDSARERINERSRTIRLPEDLDRDLEEFATANDRSVSAEIRRAVRRYLDAESPDKRGSHEHAAPDHD